MNFGKRLKEVLIWKGITQTKFAEMIGSKKTTISEWINGKNYPTLKTFIKICIILDETPNYFLDFRD